MNKKGQTLVEFVIILPVFLLILFYVIDFGRIIYSKNSLENSLNDVIFMMENNKDASITNMLGNKITVNVSNSGNYKTITLSQKINLIAPGFNLILDNPYEINVSRVIYDETTE